MTKVHSFQIKQIERIDWMFNDDPSFMAIGFNPKEKMSVDLDIMDLFKPTAGHWLIIWPHGLMTFRDDDSFKRDFTYRSGTVYETSLEALFQKGMMSPEGQAQIAAEKIAKQLKLRERAERFTASIETQSKITILDDGTIIRRVIPGLIPISESFVQPRSQHVAPLAILLNLLTK